MAFLLLINKDIQILKLTKSNYTCTILINYFRNTSCHLEDNVAYMSCSKKKANG